MTGHMISVDTRCHHPPPSAARDNNVTSDSRTSAMPCFELSFILDLNCWWEHSSSELGAPAAIQLVRLMRANSGL